MSVSIKAYTTGALARIFGVSVQAVNKWKNIGRFIGYKREGENRHNRIPETLSFSTRTGEVMVFGTKREQVSKLWIDGKNRGKVPFPGYGSKDRR